MNQFGPILVCGGLRGCRGVGMCGLKETDFLLRRKEIFITARFRKRPKHIFLLCRYICRNYKPKQDIACALRAMLGSQSKRAKKLPQNYETPSNHSDLPLSTRVNASRHRPSLSPKTRPLLSPLRRPLYPQSLLRRRSPQKNSTDARAATAWPSQIIRRRFAIGQ